MFKINNVLNRIQGRKGNKVVHHDRLKLCQDRNLPLWLERLRHSVLQPEDQKAESEPSNQEWKELSQTNTGRNDVACSAEDGSKDKSLVDPETGSRGRKIPTRMRHTPKWMQEFCLSNYACIICIYVLILFFDFVLFPFFLLPL